MRPIPPVQDGRAATAGENRPWPTELVPGAVCFHQLEYGEVLWRELRFMDATAVSVCRDTDLPIVVVDLTREGNVVRAVHGERIGTLVSRFAR